jgi:hypothetical protein
MNRDASSIRFSKVTTVFCRCDSFATFLTISTNGRMLDSPSTSRSMVSSQRSCSSNFYTRIKLIRQTTGLIICRARTSHALVQIANAALAAGCNCTIVKALTLYYLPKITHFSHRAAQLEDRLNGIPGGSKGFKQPLMPRRQLCFREGSDGCFLILSSNP